MRTVGSICANRSEEHTSELQSLRHLVCRLLLDAQPAKIYTLSLHDALPICEHLRPGKLLAAVPVAVAADENRRLDLREPVDHAARTEVRRARRPDGA